jgi:hypothetical protein
MNDFFAITVAWIIGCSSRVALYLICPSSIKNNSGSLIFLADFWWEHFVYYTGVRGIISL